MEQGGGGAGNGHRTVEVTLTVPNFVGAGPPLLQQGQIGVVAQPVDAEKGRGGVGVARRGVPHTHLH